MTDSANGGSSIGCDEPGFVDPISAQEKLRNRLRLRLNLKYWLATAMTGAVLLATLLALEPGFIAGVGGVLLMHNRHAKKRHGEAVFLAGDGAYWAGIGVICVGAVLAEHLWASALFVAVAATLCGLAQRAVHTSFSIRHGSGSRQLGRLLTIGLVALLLALVVLARALANS